MIIKALLWEGQKPHGICPSFFNLKSDMKLKYSFFFLFSLVLLSCSNTPKAPITHSSAQIEFETDTFDCGEVKIGDKAKHAFKFSNVGNTPLVVNNAGGTCACTTANYPQIPISPGEGGEIEVVYDSKNEMPSHFIKSVVVTSNSEKGSEVLFIKGLLVK